MVSRALERPEGRLIGMGDNGMHIFIPFIGLAANSLAQVAVFRFFPRIGLLRSVFFGFACGFIASLLVTRGAMSASNFAIYVLLGYCYFHFVNMGETARRIRILTELADAGNGLSLGEILGRYGSKDIIDRRLARLINSGQIRCENGRCYTGNVTVLAMAGFLAAAKRVIFGEMR